MENLLKPLVDLIKVGGRVPVALSLASIAVLQSDRLGIGLLQNVPWLEWVAWVALLIFSSLTVVSLGDALLSALEPARRVRSHLQRKRNQNRIRRLIPQLPDKEREILGYLLLRNERHITSTINGDYAAKLISMGILCRADVPGQAFSVLRVPYEIPEPISETLKKSEQQIVPDGMNKSTVRDMAPPWFDQLL